jgi:hypothetical protein
MSKGWMREWVKKSRLLEKTKNLRSPIFGLYVRTLFHQPSLLTVHCRSCMAFKKQLKTFLFWLAWLSSTVDLWQLYWLICANVWLIKINWYVSDRDVVNRQAFDTSCVTLRCCLQHALPPEPPKKQSKRHTDVVFHAGVGAPPLSRLQLLLTQF